MTAVPREVRPSAAERPTLLAATWEIFRKDVRIELRTREILATAGVFALVVAVLASMAFYVDEATNPSTAAGTIWITILFASVLSFGRIWQRERDESALTGLLVSPIPRPAIFLGKALAAFVTITAVEIPLVLLCMFLFHVDFQAGSARSIAAFEAAGQATEGAAVHVLAFAALLLAGTLALSLVGTLFGVMTVRTRARDLVLAIVLFPLLSPVLLCGAVGTRKAFEALPFESYEGFVGMMGVAACVALVLGVGLFGPLVDD